MTLFRLDYYQDDCGELIGFFTSKEAAMEYCLHDQEIHTPTRHQWSEIWEFKFSRNIDIEEKLDGRISTKKGLEAWENGRIIDSTYFQ